ncbi:MAG: DUF4250 domain-containing protein [Butyricicoccus pullicaecorum]|nr:DUF4250 domain-containing protein [Butyricicoccus pullicaecorum]MDO4668271.1 DUF4250 domain-containing protein [Butyricicoccus pullicaecorum]
MLPHDPMILLSYVNTKLRDDFSDLDDLCSALELDPAELCDRLAPFGYTYNHTHNRFQ